MDNRSGLRKFLKFLADGSDEKIDGEFGVKRFLDPEEREPKQTVEEKPVVKKYVNILTDSSLEKKLQQERVRGRLDVLGILQVMFDDCQTNDEFCEKVYKLLKFTNVYLDDDFNIKREDFFEDLEKRHG